MNWTARDRAERESSQLKYTGEAQKAYERLQTPLDKYTARQKELNKALKDGKILQADYNTLMASAKKDYESTLKKPSGVKVSAGERQEDRAHAALLALETELRTLEKHSGVNEKISQQRRICGRRESVRGTGGGGRNVASCLHRRNPCWRIKMRRLEYKTPAGCAWRQGYVSGAPERAGAAGG